MIFRGAEAAYNEAFGPKSNIGFILFKNKDVELIILCQIN